MRIEGDINREVIGIKKIYCGHTILEKADQYGNHFCIDIGAYINEDKKLHIEKI